jgi:hypothetical protein
LQIMSLHHNQSNQAGWGADPFANTTTDITWWGLYQPLRLSQLDTAVASTTSKIL